MKKLDFIVCGVQKSGTSTLHALLAEHPSLQMSAPKELHFFDDDAIDWRFPDYDRYHEPFLNADPNRLWGETTPIYLYWPNCLERIQAYRPDMRVIAVFRDPIERAYSHWWMEFTRGSDGLPFAEAIGPAERRRVTEGPAGCHRVFSYVERGFYGRQFARLLSLFPRENVLALDFARLRNGQAGLLDEISDFLGVSRPPAAAASPPRHVFARQSLPLAPGPSEADRAYLADLFAEDLRWFEALSGLHAADWLAAAAPTTP